MNKSLLLSMVLVLAMAITPAAFAAEDSPVQYTFTFIDLGQGAHGGGRLYAEGRAEGGLTLAVLNVQAIARIDATTWSAVGGGSAVDICFETQQLKGPPVLPPFLCLSAAGLILPLNGTPIVISNPFGDLALIRVTEVN